MSKVSVIIPVYNTERHLEKCINSLLAQTLKDIEIILINDCSTDKSLDILTKYQQRYPSKIKVISTKENKGPACARNLGLDIASGEYIGFVDSDDYVTNDFYEKLVTACETTNSQIARTNIKLVCGKIELTSLGRKCLCDHNTIINPKEHPRYLVTENPGCTNKLFKKSLIGNNRFPEQIKWEDYPFTIPLIVSANQIAIVPEKNYYYQLHLNSTTCKDARKLNKNLLDIFTCSDIVGEECITDEANDNIKYQIRYIQMQNCIQRLKEISNAPIPLPEKRELITLFSALIETKYGNWQNHELYKEQKEKSRVHNARMLLVENLLLDDLDTPKSENKLKQKIKTKLEENTKK